MLTRWRSTRVSALWRVFGNLDVFLPQPLSDALSVDVDHLYGVFLLQVWFLNSVVRKWTIA